MGELVDNYLEFIAPLGVVIAFMLLYKRWINNYYLKLLFAYFVASTVNFGFTSYLAYIDKPNLHWYNLQGFVSLLILSIFFTKIIKRKKIQWIIKFISVGGLIAYLLLLIIWDDNITFFSSGYSIGSLIIITNSLLYLKETFDNKEVDRANSDEIAWIISNLLTYYMGSFLIHVTYKYLTLSAIDVKDDNLWGINNLIYFFSCVMIIINLFNLKKQQRKIKKATQKGRLTA